MMVARSLLALLTLLLLACSSSRSTLSHSVTQDTTTTTTVAHASAWAELIQQLNLSLSISDTLFPLDPSFNNNINLQISPAPVPEASLMFPPLIRHTSVTARAVKKARAQSNSQNDSTAVTTSRNSTSTTTLQISASKLLTLLRIICALGLIALILLLRHTLKKLQNHGSSN